MDRQHRPKQAGLGVSASSVTEAVQAEKDGADYIGVGAMFVTGTKNDAELVTMESLKDIKRTANLPIVVIGGINKNTIPLFAVWHISVKCLINRHIPKISVI